MIDWLLQHQLFLCNTAFQHSSQHPTTWEGRFKPPGAPLSVPVYNTIDFVITPVKYRSLLYDSPSYQNQSQNVSQYTTLFIIIQNAPNASTELGIPYLPSHLTNLHKNTSTNQLISQAKSNITVHDPKGRTLTNDVSKVRRMSEWFQSQFSHPTAQALSIEDIPKGPLSNPITDLEVKDALHRLNNNRASCPDNVAGELWKYSADIVCAPLADIFNQAIAEGLTETK